MEMQTWIDLSVDATGTVFAHDWTNGEGWVCASVGVVACATYAYPDQMISELAE